MAETITTCILVCTINSNECLNFVSDIYDLITVVDHWPLSFRFNELKLLDYHDFQEFTQSFGRSCTFVALVSGNVAENEAEALGKLVTEKWPTLGSVTLDDFPVPIKMLRL